MSTSKELLTCCSVCQQLPSKDKNDKKLFRCSRCKSSAYQVCSKACQAADWKRHKKKHCFVYVEGLEETVDEHLKDENAQKDCPICLETFTKMDFLRSEVECMSCGHSSHKMCLKNMMELMLRMMMQVGQDINNDESNHFKCPICRKFVGPSFLTDGRERWFQSSPMSLLRMAIGYCFQEDQNFEPSAEEEQAFIDDRIRDATTAGQHSTLEAIYEAQQEFKELLPNLKKTPSFERREDLTHGVKRKVAMTILVHLLPGTLSPKDGKEQSVKWIPIMEKWLATLMLCGPYE